MDWIQTQNESKMDQTTKTRKPSGLTHSWKLWRHCCCRYGTYPLIVAPIVTAGCLMSLYASAGCDFIRVDIGFTPSNAAWNQSTVELGLFFYQSGEPDTNKYRAAVMDGCQWYEDDFNEAFINGDRTWKVARIMAYISGCASILATVTSWLFVFTPLPAFLFWPGVLLPSLMAAFLAEGSKFLFFDTSICRNTVWFPSGENSLPRVAEECVLGTTGTFAIAGGAVFFLGLILVCLKAPEKRLLDANYGQEFQVRRHDLESAGRYAQSEGSYEDRGSTDSYEGFDKYSFPPSGRAEPEEKHKRQKHLRSFADEESIEGDSHASGPTNLDDEDLVSERLKNLDPQEDKYTAKPTDDKDSGSPDDRYNPKKPVAPSKTPEQTVSKSRLHARERMELNSAADSEDMIQKFVNDLNVSFQADSITEEKKPEKVPEKPGFFQNLCATPNSVATTDRMCATPSAQSF